MVVLQSILSEYKPSFSPRRKEEIVQGKEILFTYQKDDSEECYQDFTLPPLFTKYPSLITLRNHQKE